MTKRAREGHIIRLGATQAGSPGEFGIEASSIVDCIRAIRRAPIEIRDATLGEMLITERRDGRVQMSVSARISWARRTVEDDWVTLSNWRDLILVPFINVTEATTVADYIYGPMPEQQIEVLSPCEAAWLSHPFDNREWQPPLFK